jgi:hypothetical protein
VKRPFSDLNLSSDNVEEVMQTSVAIENESCKAEVTLGQGDTAETLTSHLAIKSMESRNAICIESKGKCEKSKDMKVVEPSTPKSWVMKSKVWQACG